MSVDISKMVWKDPDLTPNEKLVLLAYADFAHKDGTRIFPSIGTIAEMTCYSDRNVQKITRKLVEKGYLLADGKAPGKYSGNRWCIPNDSDQLQPWNQPWQKALIEFHYGNPALIRELLGVEEKPEEEILEFIEVNQSSPLNKEEASFIQSGVKDSQPEVNFVHSGVNDARQKVNPSSPNPLLNPLINHHLITNKQNEIDFQTTFEKDPWKRILDSYCRNIDANIDKTEEELLEKAYNKFGYIPTLAAIVKAAENNEITMTQVIQRAEKMPARRTRYTQPA